jgi:signal transduction histidine kinase
MLRSWNLKTAAAPREPFGINAINAFALALFTAVGIGSAYLAFEPVVPPTTMRYWFWPAMALLVAWFCALLVFLIRQPDLHERTRIWVRISLMLQHGTWLTVLGIIWVLMPFGTPAMQFVTTLFSVCYLVGSFMSAIENAAANCLRIVTTLGSLAIVAFWIRMELWPYLLVFLAIFGVVIIVLNQIIASSIAELHSARSEAEAAREARTRFLASASHDLGQPLQAARLFFDQALRGQDPQQRATAAADAGNALGAMERLLRQMLDHLRLDSEAMVVHEIPVSAGFLIRRIASQFTPVAALAEVELIAVPCPLLVRGDIDLIERALGNLVDNALRHARAKRVLIGARRKGDRVRFWVIDDGVGVAQADLPSLFEEFFRGSDHGDHERGGFGLGLASVAGLARLMRGSAGIDVNWANGSAFFLDLPASRAIAPR